MTTEHVVRANAAACAIFKRVLGSGDTSPLTDSIGHIADLFFHSDFDYYALAQAPTVTPITHAAVAADPGTLIINVPEVEIVTFFARTTADFQLATHSLGFPPIYVVIDENGYALPNAFPVELNTGGHRTVSTYATDTDIRLKEIASPGNAALSALSKTYTVYVFRPPTADPTKPMLRIKSNDVIFGQGKFDLSLKKLRRIVSGETADLDIPVARMTDIASGQCRFVLGSGTNVDTHGSIAGNSSTYGGSLTPASPMGAVVV